MKKIFFGMLIIGLVGATMPSALAETGSVNMLNFDVNYNIENGEVISIYLEADFADLVVELVSAEDGLLEITIPRVLLDSKLSEAEDDVFFIVVDGFESEYIEIDSSSNFRTLIIPFFAGDERIDIFGTHTLVFEVSAYEIPTWIRNNAGWWADGLIGDSDFVSGLQYLIKNEVIQVPETEAGNPSNEPIPSWIKNNAKFWSDGHISDGDFVNGIQYLIQIGILQV